MMRNETKPLRMSAYYYSFEPTGNRAIDRILSAVASAGKSFHNTSDWNEDSDWQGNPYAPHPEFGGASPVEWIQRAANDAVVALASPAQAECQKNGDCPHPVVCRHFDPMCKEP